MVLVLKITSINEESKMFTGLIEEVGTVVAVQHQISGSRITVEAKMVVDGVKLGDSIAIDGVCTTVVAFDKRSFQIEASPETMRVTNFGRFKAGVRVNLERPLTPTSRIGGHYVTGHVDGQAILLSKSPEGMAVVMTFELASDELAQYVIPKGSIAVCGISLTVNTVDGRRFSVAIIPHTLSHTGLGDVALGESVNIETDLLGKYVHRFVSPMLGSAGQSLMTEAFLQEHGFMAATP